MLCTAVMMWCFTLITEARIMLLDPQTDLAAKKPFRTIGSVDFYEAEKRTRMTHPMTPDLVKKVLEKECFTFKVGRRDFLLHPLKHIEIRKAGKQKSVWTFKRVTTSGSSVVLVYASPAPRAGFEQHECIVRISAGVQDSCSCEYTRMRTIIDLKLKELLELTEERIIFASSPGRTLASRVLTVSKGGAVPDDAVVQMSNKRGVKFFEQIFSDPKRALKRVTGVHPDGEEFSITYCDLNKLIREYNSTPVEEGEVRESKPILRPIKERLEAANQAGLLVPMREDPRPEPVKEEVSKIETPPSREEGESKPDKEEGEPKSSNEDDQKRPEESESEGSIRQVIQ